MDLSPAQRVLAFVGIVVVLGGMGAYLLIPGVRSAVGQGHGAAGATPTASAQALGGRRQLPARSTAPAASCPRCRLRPGQDRTSNNGFRSARETWPRRPAWLRRSVRRTTRSPTGRALQLPGHLRGLTTSELGATLARAYGTPGVVGQRTQQKQISPPVP